MYSSLRIFLAFQLVTLPTTTSLHTPYKMILLIQLVRSRLKEAQPLLFCDEKKVFNQKTANYRLNFSSRSLQVGTNANQVSTR